MKLVHIFLLKILIIITNGYKLESYSEIHCSPLFKYIEKKQTLLLDLDDNSNVDVKTCLVKTIASEQSMLIIHELTYMDNENNKELNRFVMTTDNPNVIIITQDISPSTLFSLSIKRALTSHRSLMFILITNETRFKCKDGAMDRNDILSLKIFMNELWHEYEIMKVVVSFPVSCQHKIVIYNGKNKSNNAIYNRTIKLIDLYPTNQLSDIIRKSGVSLTKNYPLRVHIFSRYPTSIKNCKNLRYYTKINLNLIKGFCGLDGLVMYDVAKHFKFKFNFLKNHDCRNYGNVLANNITGSLGCIVRKELDISFNSRFMMMYNSEYVHFIHYIAVDALCAVVKKPDIVPLWHRIISVYDEKLWLLFISLLVIIGIIMWIMAIFNHEVTGDKRESLYFYITNAFVMITLGFSIKIKGKWYLFRSICLCFSIIFMAVYQGHINRVFTTLQRYKIITTLDSLYNSDKVLYIPPSMTDIMTQLYNKEHKAMDEFLKRTQFIEDNYLFDFVLKHPHAVLLGRKEDVKIDIYGKFLTKDGKSQIYIVNECFSNYYLSYIARPGFPFLEELQNFMEHLNEAGLPLKYYKWTCNMLRLSHFYPEYQTEPRPFAKINLYDYSIAFGLLCFGYLVSLIVFFIELRRDKY